MQPKYFDIHAHLNFPDYDADREEVIARTRETGVLVNNIGTDLKTSEEVVKLAEENDNFYATIGAHPTEWEMGFDETYFHRLAEHPRVVAIGECGLDYFRVKNEDEKKKQKELFERHVILAQEIDKPLMLHIRPAPHTYDAYADVLEILKVHSDVKAHSHFFAGDWVMARTFLNRGITLSFTGVITFTPPTAAGRVRQYDEIIKNIPINMLMAETDAPFVSPEPFRGKRAEPIHIKEVVKKIAQIRGEDEEEVRSSLLENSLKVFANRQRF